MNALRAKIAQQTLKLLATYEWKLISIDMVCRKLKLSRKKIPRNIKSKIDLLKNINKAFSQTKSIHFIEKILTNILTI